MKGCEWLEESCTMDGTDYDCMNPMPPSKNGECDHCLFGARHGELERRKKAPVWDDNKHKPAECEIHECHNTDIFQRSDFVWVCITCYWKGDVPV